MDKTTRFLSSNWKNLEPLSFEGKQFLRIYQHNFEELYLNLIWIFDHRDLLYNFTTETCFYLINQFHCLHLIKKKFHLLHSFLLGLDCISNVNKKCQLFKSKYYLNIYIGRNLLTKELEYFCPFSIKIPYLSGLFSRTNWWSNEKDDTGSRFYPRFSRSFYF